MMHAVGAESLSKVMSILNCCRKKNAFEESG